MSGDKKLPDDGVPPEDEERTAFIPAPTPSGAPPEAGGSDEGPDVELDSNAADADGWSPAPEEPEPDSEEAWGSPPGDAEPSPESDWGTPPDAEPATPADEGWGTPPVGSDEPTAGERGANDEDRSQPAEEEGEDKTRWMPSPSGEPAEESWSALDGEPGEPPAAPDPGYAPTPTSLPETTSGSAIQTSFAPTPGARDIEVGDVLNHIFEVKRFIAAGGMGKVYEGINVSSEERVAIKVMLPQLAADPNVISMFRKEARTLTKLQHEALVQYRVLAQEPQLGVLYIVTEYIDGANLADQLGRIDPSPAELTALLRRLASGLRAAHALNAIHRDISPDNVLLEEGKLSRAKIIDFGIAKNLDPGSATIIGEGFAGKLSYVAPEQLGDFGRNVGTWTDVYGLALVILAVAQGRNVQLGGSLVDAVDKRRAGIDLSGAPEALRPVLEKMLKANPLERLQTMDDVLAELDRSAGTTKAAPPAAPRIPPLWLAGGVGALLVAIVGGWLLLSGGPGPEEGAGTEAVEPAAASDPAEAARLALDSAFPSVDCTWLEIVDIRPTGGAPAISFTGVAGNPGAAQNQLGRALEAVGFQGASLDFEEVATIIPGGCAALNGYRAIRQPNPGGISVPQREFEMKMQAEGTMYPNQLAANAVINMRVADDQDFTIIGIEPSGQIDQEFASRAALDEFIADYGGLIQKTDDGYRLQLDSDHQGWTGVLLITGKPPFEADIVAPRLAGRGPDWLSRFATIAAEREWRAEMVWYKLVDEVRN